MRHCPAGTNQTCVSTLSVVGSIFARALIHRIVVYEVFLIARQAVQSVGTELSDIQGAIPQTSFHHTSLVVLTCLAAEFVCATEDQRTSACVLTLQFIATTDNLTITEELQGAISLIDADSHLTEGIRLNGSLRREGLIVDHSTQLIVLSKPQL